MSSTCLVPKKIILYRSFRKKIPDIIYLCLPNNPTGTTITKDQLQEWVDYANRIGAVIIYDGAYEAYISEDNVAHTIYECEGARTCAIELKELLQECWIYRCSSGIRSCSERPEMRRRFLTCRCGQDVMEQNSTVLRILYSVPARLFTVRLVRHS